MRVTIKPCFYVQQINIYKLLTVWSPVMKDQRSVQVINFICRTDGAAEKAGPSLRARKWRQRLAATC